MANKPFIEHLQDAFDVHISGDLKDAVRMDNNRILNIVTVTADVQHAKDNVRGSAFSLRFQKSEVSWAWVVEDERAHMSSTSWGSGEYLQSAQSPNLMRLLDFTPAVRTEVVMDFCKQLQSLRARIGVLRAASITSHCKTRDHDHVFFMNELYFGLEYFIQTLKESVLKKHLDLYS